MSIITDVFRLVGNWLPHNENLILQEQLLEEITSTIDHSLNAIQEGRHEYVQNIICLFIESESLLNQTIGIHLEGQADFIEGELDQLLEMQSRINYGRITLLTEINAFFTEKYDFCREQDQNSLNLAIQRFKEVKKLNDEYYFVLQKLFHTSLAKNKYFRDICENSFQIVQSLVNSANQILLQWLRADIYVMYSI